MQHCTCTDHWISIAISMYTFAIEPIILMHIHVLNIFIWTTRLLMHWWKISILSHELDFFCSKHYNSAYVYSYCEIIVTYQSFCGVLFCFVVVLCSCTLYTSIMQFCLTKWGLISWFACVHHWYIHLYIYIYIQWCNSCYQNLHQEYIRNLICYFVQ